MGAGCHRGRLCVAVVLAALYFPAAAGATTTCDFSSNVLSVDMTGQNAFAMIDPVPANGQILVREQGSIKTCTGSQATLTNTDNIVIVDHTDNPMIAGTDDGDSDVTISEADLLTPGAADEAGTQDNEIELLITPEHRVTTTC